MCVRARAEPVVFTASLFALGGVGIGCSGPPVEVRAVWMDERGDRIRVYDAGRFHEYEARPLPFYGDDQPRVQLGPKGRFMLVRDGPETPRLGRVFDLEQRRNFGVSLPEILPGSVDRVRFMPRGDALGWTEGVCIGGECAPPSLYLAPLAAGLSGSEGASRQELLSAGPVETNSQVFGAADAPVVFTLGASELGAYRYPTDPADAYELQTLGLEVAGDLLPPLHVDECPFPNWCRQNPVVAPGGGSLVYSTFDSSCASGLERWAPPLTASCLELPEGLEDARLLAALGPERLALVDSERLYVVDVRSGWSEALPILGDGDYFFRLAHDGRTLVFGSYDGPVLLATEEGVELLSNATTECQDPAAPIVSADGSWVAWRCGRAPDVQLGPDFASAMVRVTDGRLDRYPGVSAWPIGIDDDGDLLFFTTIGSGEEIPDNRVQEDGGEPLDAGLDGSTSEGLDGGVEWGEADWGADAGDGDGLDDLLNPYPGGSIERLTPKPLTLYALSSDGVIRRVHDLEPTPIPTKRIEDGVLRYLQSQ